MPKTGVGWGRLSGRLEAARRQGEERFPRTTCRSLWMPGHRWLVHGKPKLGAALGLPHWFPSPGPLRAGVPAGPPALEPGAKPTQDLQGEGREGN